MEEVSLKEHLEDRIDSLVVQLHTATNSIRESTILAKDTIDRRIDQLTEDLKEIQVWKSTRGDVAPKEYIDLQVSHLQSKVEIQMDSSAKALILAQERLNSRLDTMNEFREAMSDQAKTFIPRTEHAAIENRINTQLQELRDFRISMDAKADKGSVDRVLWFALIGVVIGVLNIVLRIVGV